MPPSAEPYRFATRLNSFKQSGGGDTLRMIERVAGVAGIGALELNYPQHFLGRPPRDVLAAAADHGLPVTALNLRYDGPDFALGAFTNPVAAHRQRAVDVSVAAVGFAAEHDIPHVILWMGPDGFDGPLQADYRRLWEMEIAGFRRVADAASGVRLSVEYKPSDPRRVSLIRTMADALLAAGEVGLPNFGVTLDFCHALMTGEHPALAAALALRAGRLFGVHLNDGHGPADDGLPVGSVHPWHTLELLLELRGGYGGTIYFDTFPDRMDPRVECEANIGMVRRLLDIADAIPPEHLADIRERQDGLAAARLLGGLLRRG